MESQEPMSNQTSQSEKINASKIRQIEYSYIFGFIRPEREHECVEVNPLLQA